jgi:hypothetical protein
MPYIIRPPRKRTLVAAVTTALLSFGAMPALAQASTPCPAEETAKPLLASYGDSHEYTILPGSRFDSGTAGWTLQGASVASEGKTNPVTGSLHSLVLGAGGEVVSPAFCVSSEYPSFRFFTRRVSGFGGGSGLSVNLRFKNDDGWAREVNSGSLNTGSNWELTPVLGLASVLPLWQPEATLKVQLVIRAGGYYGSWAIDDVFIDPYRK